MLGRVFALKGLSPGHSVSFLVHDKVFQSSAHTLRAGCDRLSKRCMASRVPPLARSLNQIWVQKMNWEFFFVLRWLLFFHYKTNRQVRTISLEQQKGRLLSRVQNLWEQGTYSWLLLKFFLQRWLSCFLGWGFWGGFWHINPVKQDGDRITQICWAVGMGMFGGSFYRPDLILYFMFI